MENGNKSEQKKMIGCLLMVLFLICILNVTGVSMHVETMQPIATKQQKVEKKKIALTFDDGPNSICTKRLLDGLKERNVKASFFVLGENVKEYPKLAKRMAAEGHLIGNHTYSHVELTKMAENRAKEELEKTNEIVYQVTGIQPEYMRPPYGECSKKLEDSVDMILVRWTIDPRDWNTDNTEQIVKKVVTSAKENDIILLHDCYRSSVDAAFEIIDQLTEEGFEFVTVDEICVDT